LPVSSLRTRLEKQRILAVSVVILLVLLGGSASLFGGLANAESLGSWVSTTSYPMGIEEQSCAISSSLIFCVGGWTGSSVANAVYYATVSPSGVGSWSPTASYPTGVEAQSCDIYLGYFY
jgi:hypothetical protein